MASKGKRPLASTMLEIRSFSGEKRVESSFYTSTRPLYSMLTASVAIVACLLVGCRTVGPDYCGTASPVLPVTYETPLGCEATSSASLLACQASCEPRMVLFSDPGLNALIARAEQQNFSLCEAYHRIVEARAWAKMTRGGLWPQADAIAEYSRTKRSNNARPFVGTNGVPFDLFSLGFDSSWEIDLFGKIHREIEVSEAELAAMQENYQDVRLTLLADVATNYVRVRVLQQQLQIAQHNLKLQEETSELIEELQGAGKVTTLDVAQAKSLRYATMSDVPEIEQQLQLAFNQLSILLGEAPGPAMRACLGYGPIPAPPRLPALGLPADLVRRRPDIRRAEQDVVAASARIGVAKADLYPQLSLLGALSVDSKNVSSLFTTDSLTFSAGPSFRWNILNFWRVTSSVKAHEALYAQAVTRYRSTVLNAVREVEDGLSNNHWEDFRKTALEQTTLADAEAVKLALARYKSGKANYQRVLDSQKQLLRDEQSLARSRGAVTLELIRISKAVGGGWCASDTATYHETKSDYSTLGDNLFPVPKKPSEASPIKTPKPANTNKPADTELKKPTPAKLPKSSLPARKAAPKTPTPKIPTPKPPAKGSDTKKATAVSPSPSVHQVYPTIESESMWRLPSQPPVEKSQARQSSEPEYPNTEFQTLEFSILKEPAASPKEPTAGHPDLVATRTSSIVTKRAPLSSGLSSGQENDFANPTRPAASSLIEQPLWKKLVICLLTITTGWLSISLLSILSRRKGSQ